MQEHTYVGIFFFIKLQDQAFLFYFKNGKIQCQAFIFDQGPFSKIAWSNVTWHVTLLSKKFFFKNLVKRSKKIEYFFKKNNST